MEERPEPETLEFTNPDSTTTNEDEQIFQTQVLDTDNRDGTTEPDNAQSDGQTQEIMPLQATTQQSATTASEPAATETDGFLTPVTFILLSALVILVVGATSYYILRKGKA